MISNNLWSRTFQIKKKYRRKQPSRGVLKKRCSENMQQIYRRTPMPKCRYSPVNLLHIFRKPLSKNTSKWLLLYRVFSFTKLGFLRLHNFGKGRFQKHPFTVVLSKSFSEKFHKIYRKIPPAKSPFNKPSGMKPPTLFLKKTPAKVFN